MAQLIVTRSFAEPLLQVQAVAVGGQVLASPYQSRTDAGAQFAGAPSVPFSSSLNVRLGRLRIPQQAPHLLRRRQLQRRLALQVLCAAPVLAL